MVLDHYGRSQAQVDLDAQKIAEFARRISDGEEELKKAGGLAETLSHQDPSIWTDERGAKEFRRHFTQDMLEIKKEIARLKACLSELQRNVRAAQGAMITADRDAQLAIDIKKSILAQPTSEADPNASLFSGAGRGRVGNPHGGARAE